MVAWPEHFPVRPPDGAWVIDTIDPTVRTQPDLGPPMVRLRYSIEWERWVGTLTLTEDQKDELIAFWKTDCSYGTVEFTAMHWADLLSEVTLQWAERPGPIEHVAKEFYRVGVAFIRMP